MKSHHRSAAPVILGLNDGLGAEPVMSVDYIEMSPLIAFSLAHKVNNTIAHVVHLRHKIGMKVNGTAMVMDTVNQLVSRLSYPDSHENVHFMPTTL